MQADDSKYTKAAARIQALIRGVLTRERVKRMAKDFYRRKMIIKELLDTEENYIRDLSIIVSDFQTPLVNKKIISREQADTIFMNINQIRQLNELFFATIFEAASQYWHFKIIFDKIEKEIHFFKLYFEYLNNYTSSSLLVDQLMKDKDFEDFINKARLNPYHKLLSLKDYLIKPVQRLPKYVLIMKEVKKRTPSDHPDYQNIEKALRLFEEVNQSNNDKLNKVLDNLKINEIEKKLDLPHPISEPGVEFVLEEPVTVVTHEGHIVEATLYLLNTELIVGCRAGSQKEKLLAIVPFKNGGASIMSNEEHYFYKDTFTVQNGEGDSCMFLCTRQQDREALIQKIYNELMKAEQRTLDKLSALCNVKNREGVEFLKRMTRLDLLPDIQILGTDERNDNMFKYTVYIIQIRIKSIKQKVFLRFKELLDLQEEIQRQYGLTLKNVLFKTTWVTNHKPKKIEQRKIAIQKFLKEILSRQEIIQHGQQILTRIGLPQDFFKLPEIYKDSQSILKKSAIFQRQTSEKSSLANNKSIMFKTKSPSIFTSIHQLHMEEYEKEPFRNRPKSRQISIQDILKANELHLGHFTRYTQIMVGNKRPRENITVDILIPWIQNEKGFVRQRLQMQSDERVSNLIDNLSKQIGLKYFKDFRINLEREFAGRILDDDECLPKVMEEMKCGKYLLIFKKVIYVSPEIQEHELRSDRVRLKIIASQVIYDCKKDKYLLDYQIILRLSTFIGILQLFADEQDKDQAEIDEILDDDNLALRTRSLVTSTYTSFYDGPATWKQDYKQAFKLVLKKLQDISMRNHHVFRTSGIHNQERQYNTTQLGQLAAISIITQMKSNVFYGSISFVVQISQWFRKFLIKFGDEDQQSYDNRNCWLIIKYDSMHLYSISLETRIFSFTYEQLYKIQPYPSSILLHVRDREIDLLKLKTANSYSIRQMLLYYKNYSSIIRRMEEDESFEGTILQLAIEENRHNISIRTFNQ